MNAFLSPVRSLIESVDFLTPFIGMNHEFDTYFTNNHHSIFKLQY